MSRKPTQQQQSCIDALVSGVMMLKVEACAGSGKTSTLTMMAGAKEAPSLYLAFNKVTANEAAEKFPPYVKCQTTHSRAYATFGKRLQHKLVRPRGRYVNVAGTGAEIARYYNIESFENRDGVVITAPYIGLLVRDTVARFEQSADERIESKHVPTMELKQKLHDNTQNVAFIVDAVTKLARRLWDERTNESSVVLATHDTYLKLFQLSKPVFGGIEVLYVDEFQDTTPCVFDIIMNQKGRMQIVMVGDARQAIYGWRGAVNAMQMVQSDVRHLTKSFRYGQAVADIATTVLERDMQITGNEAIESVARPRDVVDTTLPYTRLFRTNSALLYAAVEDIVAGKAVSLEIDVKDFVKLLQSAKALREGAMKDVKHDKLLPYQNWDEMVGESKSDAELGRICKVINEGLADRWIKILETHVNADNPQVTFTTAHKSKGREWEQVIIEDDFKSCYNDDGEWVGLSTEEQNLLYVAATRAIKKLQYNNTVSEYLNAEKALERPTNTVKVLKARPDACFDYSLALRGDMSLFSLQQEMEALEMDTPPWQ